MKKIFLLILIFSSLSLSAQDWSKETRKDFLKVKNVGLIVDYSEATIMEVSTEDYPEYFCGKFSSNEKHAKLILEKFIKRFRLGFSLATKKELVDIKDSRYVVTYKILNITEKGGFSGLYYVECNGNRSETNSFEMKDGRWNDFETLLMENVEKFWNRLNHLTPMTGNPIFDKLYRGQPVVHKWQKYEL